MPTESPHRALSPRAARGFHRSPCARTCRRRSRARCKDGGGLAENLTRVYVLRGPFFGDFRVTLPHGQRRSAGFIILRSRRRGEPRQRLAIVPGHPLNWRFPCDIQLASGSSTPSDSRGVFRDKASHLDQGSQSRWTPLQQLGQILSRMFGSAEVQSDSPARPLGNDAAGEDAGARVGRFQRQMQNPAALRFLYGPANRFSARPNGAAPAKLPSRSTFVPSRALLRPDSQATIPRTRCLVPCNQPCVLDCIERLPAFVSRRRSREPRSRALWQIRRPG